MNMSDDPEVDTATLQQMAYNSNFTEDINIRMRVPETITVEDKNHDDQYNRSQPNFFHPSINSKYDAQNSSAALKMQVPDRIVVSVGKDGMQYDQGEIRVPSPEFGAYNPESNLVSLKTPPRVLTLQDHQFDALDVDSQPHVDESNAEEPFIHGEEEQVPMLQRQNRPTKLELTNNERRLVKIHDESTHRSLLKDLQNESKNFYYTVMKKLHRRSSRDENYDYDWLEKDKHEKDVVFVCGCMSSSNTLSQCSSITASPSGSALTDSSIEDLDEVTLMRKQVYKLHKRLSLLEQEQATHVQRDYIIYGVTAALWLLNGWFLYNHRRLY